MNRPPLAACPSCSRHVRLSETACPFCKAGLPSAFRERPAPSPPVRRLGRAALYALRMGAVSVTAVAACGGAVTAAGGDGGEGDSSALGDGSSGASSSGSAGSGSANSGTASSGTTGSGTAGSGLGSSGTSVDAGFDGPFGVAAYGGFIPADAGVTGTGDATSARDAEPGDAKSDHPFIAPPYGVPPGP
ncbi:MAG TPA: hypothetical protein VKU41_16610 [Polyangiaceae bacterium]|nr:hypothetical protein [Polyangiaceae bacterium]